MSEKIEPVAVVMADGNICWLKDWLMSDDWVRSSQGEKLYHATTVSALEARVAQLCEVIGGKEVATEDECQIHRGACFELSDVLIASGHLKVDHDGGADAAWRNVIDAVKRLTGASQP